MTSRPIPLLLAALALALRPSPVAAASQVLEGEQVADQPVYPLARETAVDRLVPVAQDPRLRLVMHPPVVIMAGDGRQPFLLCTSRGTLFCQAQLAAKPFGTKGKMVYPTLIGSAISRDGGLTWKRWTYREGCDDVNIEGGALECADGTILLLDTYAVPSPRTDHGIGELWRSRDDLRTFDGPAPVDVYLPGINWSGSTDDVGRSHSAARLHRSLIEMPGGDLVTTVYTWFEGDTAPSAYLPSMKKTRCALLRSHDRGQTWAYQSTIAVDGAVGTEGFGEPVLVRVSRGTHAGRLICLMRTGRDLYRARSDDGGGSWSRPEPERFPGIDIYDTAKWEGLFSGAGAPGAVPTDQMFGSVVDPDLVEMRDGTLVCTVGVRIPARRFTSNWHAPMNGNYLAFSLDGGDTWSHVVQFRSGAPTTQYMSVREVEPGVLYVAYDDSVWGMPGRAMGFRLEVGRAAVPN